MVAAAPDERAGRRKTGGEADDAWGRERKIEAVDGTAFEVRREADAAAAVGEVAGEVAGEVIH